MEKNLLPLEVLEIKAYIHNHKQIPHNFPPVEGGLF
jgi:hypothetical protein